MQIKKTELAKIIRDEIANVIEEARRMDRFRRGRRPYPSYMAMANIHRDNIDMKKKQIERYQAILDNESASDEDKEEARKWIDTLNRRIADDEALLGAEMEKLKRFGRIREEEIQAARFDHAHLPGNDKEGQFGKVQQLEEVGMISTFMDPAMFAGLSPAAQALLGILDPILTVSGVGAVTTALMTYFRGPNKEMPTVAKIPDAEAQMLMRAFQEVEREIGADKVDQPGERKAALDTLRKELESTPKRAEEPEVDTGIPADELGAKR